MSAVVPVPIIESASQPDVAIKTGLSSTEARRRRAESGTNTLPDTSASTWRMVLEKFWAPVPWMLEAAVILQCVLGRLVEAGIIAGLLVFNAVLGVLQESRARATLAALKSRLAMNASVLRDGTWSIVPAADLVKGDVVKLSLGGVVAADMRIVSGNALLDHSMLTGESVPIEAPSGTQTFAGALVRRGEALALVTAIGANTRFGRTAELLRTAHVASSQQKAVLLVVRNLAAFSVAVIAFLVGYALYLHMPLAEIVPLILTAVLASIPVALPATFTLSAVFAGVLPEDKYKLVKAFQQSGHTVGMCGDGANDAPALRQAQIGIAVSTATDVAKSAAGMVLTEAGLGGVVTAVKEGRLTFQRILTYTLNSVLKKIATAFLLVIGLLVTGHAILTPLLMVILMIAGDFLAMSLTTDRVEPSPSPNVWRISDLTVVGVFIGLALVAFCGGALAIGKFAMGMNIDALRTLTFVVLVFGGQATLYAIRHRRRMWGTRPSVWMGASSIADVLIAAGLAIGGIAMATLPPVLIGEVFAATVAFAFVLAAAKIPVFAHLKIS